MVAMNELVLVLGLHSFDRAGLIQRGSLGYHSNCMVMNDVNCAEAMKMRDEVEKATGGKVASVRDGGSYMEFAVRIPKIIRDETK